MKKVAVIGSGVSGIASAYYLKNKGFEVDIYESSSAPGGRVGSEKINDKYLDFGGKNIGYNYKLFREFVSNQGDFSFEYFGVNTSKVIDGQIVPINREKNLKSFFRLFKLATFFDIIKVFRLVRNVKKFSENSFLNSRYFNDLSKKYDYQTLDNYFSKKCSKNILRAMTVRMNGAEPDECYFGNFGSNLGTAFDKYEQITDGMHAVIEKFLLKVNIFSNTVVKRIVIEEGKVNGIEIVDSRGENKFVKYDTVFSAVPAYKASELLVDTLPSLQNTLLEMKYNSVLTMIVKYEKPVFNSEVRAVIFEPNVALSNAGAYGINDLDIVRYTFSGRAARNLINSSTSPEELMQIINKVMPQEFKVKDNRVIESSYRLYEKGLCSYSQYHHRNIEKIKEESSKVSGLYLCGDYFRGASIEACFRSALDSVKKL